MEMANCPPLLRSRRQQCVTLLGLFLLYYFGVFAMLFQSSIETFDYPLSEPVKEYVRYWMDNGSPIRDAINSYPYRFIHSPNDKCVVDADTRLRLVYLVKSAMEHFNRRVAIRKTWGFERRFSDVEIRTVFILGTKSERGIQLRVEDESRKYGDIVQADFTDSYYNNTIKTMVAITWAVKFCSKSKFYFFSDDDEYVSTKNVLRFSRNPLNYPQYLEEHLEVIRNKKAGQFSRGLRQIVDIDLADDAELYAGYVFRNSRPHRHQPSKWYLSLSEYPYDFFPPYVTAGSFILTNKVLKKFYFASFYTQHFRFDDIYLSILAKKVGIAPLHSEDFYFDKKPYSVNGYRYVVASHGYSDPDELMKVWEQQKGAGNA